MQRITGTLLIAISAASFGTLAIFGRFLYADGLDTFTMLFLRFGIAALIMIFILFMRKESLPQGKILLQLIGMGALGYVGQSFSYLTAIQYASAGLVALLLYLYPMFVFILSVIVLHEKATWIGAHFPTTNTSWLGVAGIVLVATVIPVVTFLAGLERIGPTNASMLSTLEPVVTVLLAAWIFSEHLEAITIVGGGLILVAVLLLTRGEIKIRTKST